LRAMKATGIDVLAAARSGGRRRHEEGRNGCESSNARSLLGAGLPRSEGDSQHHPAGDPAVEAEARDAAVEAQARDAAVEGQARDAAVEAGAREVVGVAAADLLIRLAPRVRRGHGCSIISTTWDHEAWPEVKLVLRRVLETRRKIAGGLVKLDALRPSSPPKASCQPSFQMDPLRSGGITESPVVSVSSRLALRLRPLLARPSGAACGPACRLKGRVCADHRRGTRLAAGQYQIACRSQLRARPHHISGPAPGSCPCCARHCALQEGARRPAT